MHMYVCVYNMTAMLVYDEHIWDIIEVNYGLMVNGLEMDFDST